ncbi:MAG TPA: hypothetical protein VFQ85_03390 [Mycobacteriales bacterium]|jgi:hypothetical protein|nr:hypothetical protein [Mycobacteriales bacterium]
MRKLAIAAIAAGTLLSGLSASSNAQGEPLIGSVCGYSSTNDPSGAVNQDPNHNYGEIDGGPLAVGDLGDAFPISVPPAVPPTVPSQAPHASSGTLLCWIQLTGTYNYAATDGKYGYPGLAGASASGTGVLVIPHTVVEYDAATTADQYLCSAVINVDGDGANDWLYDANWVDPDTGQTTGNLVPANSTPTPVCGLAISAG